ncbi:MAG: DUF6067 family protein [Planctomycetota bacterium]|nr:DUF6067 family protein [Planctomycetota bacterium]
MKDAVDVQIALKNHGKRSETVQLGFFVENAEGLVYSSYDDPALSDGFVEVVPGEAKELRLKQRFPGISANGNALWFDVRSTGQPAKVLYRTRLMNFHGMDGGVVNDVPFKWRRLDSIAKLRPPRKDFELRFAYSNYSNKLSAIVDRGVNGASEEAKSAVEAKILVVTADEDEQEVFAGAARFHGNFACLLAEMPELKEGKYKLWTLLLDANQRIVGEAVSDPFAKRKAPWERNELGRNDVVWEPFTPLAVRGLEFETLKHRFTLAPSGLPEQLVIRPEPEDLPLELRAAGAKPEPAQLVAVGRGPQLRAPIRLVARIAGKEVEAAVVEPAKPVRTWQSEVEYQAALKLGALPVRLTTQYDCDGAMTAKLTYGGPEAVEIEALELVMDVAGQVDTALSTTRGGGMASADAWDCALPQKEGVVWDSAALEYPELVYTHFVPWFWFGSGDRAFTWICDSDEHWLLDRDGSSMLLERDKQGEVTLRVKFVNHKAAVNGERTVTFMLLTHPAKPKPAGHRELSWNLRGAEWAEGYMQAWGPIDKPDHLLDGDRVKEIESYKKRKVPEDAALAKLAETEPLQFHADAPPWRRYYQLRGMVGPLPAIVENAYTGDLLGENRGQPAPVTSVRLVDSQEQKVAVERAAGAMCQMGEAWQDLFVYYLGRHVRISRKHGWWWDETWPVYRNDCLATGAYLRDPQDVRLKTEETDEEVPWQPSYLTLPMRGMFKRLARVFKESNVPNRNQFWANNSATAFESFGFDTQLVEECCADPKSLDLDNVVVYPLPLFRYAAHNYSGLVARITSLGIAGAGDDKKYDRQYIGRGLLHDIGVQPVGPHGRHSHVEQFMRIQNRLYEFGYFEPQGTEYLPYWRNGAFVQAGREGDPGPSKLHVSVFRRRFEKDGRAGTHAIFVLMNEHDEAVEAPLRLLDDARLLGGKNGLTAAEVYAGASVAEPLKAWWAGLAQRDGAAAALRDFETGEAIPRQGEAETYGPVFVPAHDYRVLYARRLDPK